MTPFCTIDKNNEAALYDSTFIQGIKRIVADARRKAYTAINASMVEAYWLMGKRIVEQEQQGRGRADYGSQLLKSMSRELTKEFGKGFSVNSLYYFRQFYMVFPKIFPTPQGILTWSHYKRLLSVSNATARTWYLNEASRQMWSYRTLDRNIDMIYMPTEEELREEIERQKRFFRLQYDNPPGNMMQD